MEEEEELEEEAINEFVMEEAIGEPVVDLGKMARGKVVKKRRKRRCEMSEERVEETNEDISEGEIVK